MLPPCLLHCIPLKMKLLGLPLLWKLSISQLRSPLALYFWSNKSPSLDFSWSGIVEGISWIDVNLLQSSLTSLNSLIFPRMWLGNRLTKSLVTLSLASHLWIYSSLYLLFMKILPLLFVGAWKPSIRENHCSISIIKKFSILDFQESKLVEVYGGATLVSNPSPSWNCILKLSFLISLTLTIFASTSSPSSFSCYAWPFRWWFRWRAALLWYHLLGPKVARGGVNSSSRSLGAWRCSALLGVDCFFKNMQRKIQKQIQPR